MGSTISGIAYGCPDYGYDNNLELYELEDMLYEEGINGISSSYESDTDWVGCVLIYHGQGSRGVHDLQPVIDREGEWAAKLDEAEQAWEQFRAFLLARDYEDPGEGKLFFYSDHD